MTNLLLLVTFLSAFALFGQEYQIEIRLVDENIGRPGSNSGQNYPAESNDVGLNNIFSAFNATHYYPGHNYIEQWRDRTHFVICEGCDINAFEQALIDYSSVVENTIQCPPGTQNALYVRLISLDNGTNTGNTTPEGIVITDNEDLNLIFVNYSVMYYESSFGPPNPFPRLFTAACDCNASELLPILEAETETIESVTQLGYVILDVSDNEKLDFEMFPNPVDDVVSIQTTEDIKSFEIFNMLGQTMGKVTSIAALNTTIPVLKAGIYFLRINTFEGVTGVYRFIKS
jgi:hypothetical protein